MDPHPETNTPDAEPDPDAIVAELEALRVERDELTAKYQRLLADFQNFQRRSLANERDAKDQGVRSVALGVLGVVDHFDQALALDPARVTPAQLLTGLEAIRAELLKSLAGFGVTAISPAVGDAFEPGRHEALMQRPAPGVASGCISQVVQAGYVLGGRVIRPAKVAVAPQTEQSE